MWFAAQPLVGHAEPMVALLCGRLIVDAGGALNSASWFKGGTWTKGANGEYTLTLEAKYRVNDSTKGTLTYGLAKAAAGVQAVEKKSQDFSTGVYVFRFIDMTSGTGTDPAAAVSLDVQIQLLGSSLTKG